MACGNSSKVIKSNFSVQSNTTKNIIANSEVLQLTLSNPNNKRIDSVSFSMNNKVISETIDLSDISLGEKMIKANVYFEGKKEVALQKIIIVNSTTPKLYRYEIVNTYPHDITSYTQGLEFYDGVLYESTGQYGESKLRALDYKTGKVLKNINLSPPILVKGLPF